MIIETRIHTKLQERFAPLHLEVINESGNHHVPPGSETHFKVVMVADAFEGKALIARHRLINQALAEELAGGVHALAMKLMTPAQWEAAQGVHGHTSPRCAHAEEPALDLP